jgi:hypothetical protein
MNFRTLNPAKCRVAREEATAEDIVSEIMLPGRAFHVPQGRCQMNMEHWLSNDWQEKTEVLRENPDSMPLCPPQVSHRLPCNRFRATEVGNRQLHTIVRSLNCLSSLRARGPELESWSFAVDLPYSISSIFVSVWDVKHADG